MEFQQKSDEKTKMKVNLRKMRKPGRKIQIWHVKEINSIKPSLIPVQRKIVGFNSNIGKTQRYIQGEQIKKVTMFCDLCWKISKFRKQMPSKTSLDKQNICSKRFPKKLSTRKKKLSQWKIEGRLKWTIDLFKHVMISFIYNTVVGDHIIIIKTTSFNY